MSQKADKFDTADFCARARVKLRQSWPDEAFDPLTRPHHGDHRLNECLPNEMILAPARPAAVLAPVVARDGEATLLLTQRAAALRDHSGQIAFPGGKIEPGESPLDAALREVEEEIGLARENIEILAVSTLIRPAPAFASSLWSGWFGRLLPSTSTTRKWMMSSRRPYPF